ncbi:hypothetical protein XF14_12995 [Burkholderia gladioli]|nr:hypothetical protein XF14_12995 [Burkholderia gladioli]
MSRLQYDLTVDVGTSQEMDEVERMVLEKVDVVSSHMSEITPLRRTFVILVSRSRVAFNLAGEMVCSGMAKTAFVQMHG